MSREQEVLAEHVAVWMRKAQRDLVAATMGAGADPPLLDDAVFHCQQAAEKALKGALTAFGIVFTKTHDIEELAGLIVRRDPGLADVARRAAGLTDYAWCYRYPGDADEPPLVEALEALELARAVVAAVEERVLLGPTAGPPSR